MVDVRLLIYTDIKCPDYGKLNIARRIPPYALSKFLNVQTDTEKVYKDLICSIIEEESFDFTNLSKNDLDFIAKKIANLYEVESQYLDSRKLGIPPSKSLLAILKESPIVKNFGNFKGLIKPLYERLKINSIAIERVFEPILRNERAIIGMMDFQSGIQKMAKELEGISEFHKSLGGIAGIMNAFEGLTFGKMLAEYLQKNSIELHKMSQSMISNLSISEVYSQAYQSRMTELFQNINSIRDTLEPVSDLLSTTETAYKSLKNIGKKISTFSEPLDLTNSALIISGKIVSQANNFFLKSKKLKPFLPKRHLPKKLYKYEDLLTENNENFEQILQYEAGDSIILTNDIAMALKEKITEDIREIIKSEFSQYDYFFKRAKTLGNPISFLYFLKKAAKYIKQNLSHLYWKERGKNFIPNPESHAQGHLGIYISGRFEDIAFIGPELKSGFGYIDLLINFMGVDYIIEIKMLGASWSIGWVESGLDQLDNYMEIYDKSESYLFVLDGRITDKGKQLKNEYVLKNGKVYVVKSRIC